jgi:hypothetical protein
MNLRFRFSKEPRPQGGALGPKFINQKTRSRNKFGMTKRPEPNRHVMLNLFQHLVCLFSAFSRRIFHFRLQEGVFRCEFSKLLSPYSELRTPNYKFEVLA